MQVYTSIIHQKRYNTTGTVSVAAAANTTYYFRFLFNRTIFSEITRGWVAFPEDLPKTKLFIIAGARFYKLNVLSVTQHRRDIVVVKSEQKKLTSRAVSSSPASSALTLSSRRVALGTVVANAALSTSSSELTWRTSCNSKRTMLLVSEKSQPFKFKSDVQILLLLLLLWLMMLLHPCTKIGLEIDEVALNARKYTCGYFKLHLSWKIATSSH